jgi:hypothetical protein
MKDKKQIESSSSSSEYEEIDNNNNDDHYDDDQISTSSSKDEETIRQVKKVTRKIHKINFMVVSIQVEDILFNINRKEQRKRGGFTCGRRVTLGIIAQTRLHLKKEAKVKYSHQLRHGMIHQLKMKLH